MELRKIAFLLLGNLKDNSATALLQPKYKRFETNTGEQNFALKLALNVQKPLFAF
jgi:hypothetical protein